MINRRSAIRGIIAGVLAPAILSAARAKANGSTWSSGPPLPLPVQEIYATVNKGEIWLAGGLASSASGSISISRRCFIFDPRANQWRDGAALSEPMHHAQLVSTGDELYLIGGFRAASGGAWSMRHEVEILTENGWEPGPALPRPLAETHAAWLGNRIHLAGGRTPFGSSNAQWQDHDDTDLHLVFDPQTGDWSEAAPLPVARNSGAAVVSKGRMHVIGGRTVEGGNRSDHHAYDPQGDSWQTLAPMPEGRGGIAAAVIGETIHVLGGEYFDEDGGVFETVLAYDVASDDWRDAGPMPQPRHGLAAVAIGERIYALGGATRPGAQSATKAVDILTPLFSPQ